METEESDRSSLAGGSPPRPNKACAELMENEALSVTQSGLDLSWLREIPEDRCDFEWELGTVVRVPKGIRLTGLCRKCARPTSKWLHNLKAGKSLKCQCSPRGVYMDTRAKMLGARYGAMIQRCYTDTHVSSHNYKGRGIQVLFKRREFIQWALARWPEETFLNMDFDREDNDGHYTFENLRLIPRVRNLRNTRLSVHSLWTQTEAFMQMHPDFALQPRHVWNLLQQKKTWQEIERLAVANRNLTKMVRQQKLCKQDAKAERLMRPHPELVLGVSLVAKLLRQDVNQIEILRVNDWHNGVLPLESLHPVTQVMLTNQELTYSWGHLYQLLKIGLSGPEILTRWKARQQTPRAVALRFVAAYPGSYSVDTAYRHFKQGVTWDQLAAKVGSKFQSKTPMT